MKVKVKNMISDRSNRAIANQFIIMTDTGTYFQSYNSVIVYSPYNDGKIQLDEKYWDYSRTTSRYRNIFLRESKTDTEKKIESGEYELVNLND